MSTALSRPARPLGVTLVAVLLFISGFVGVIGGFLGVIGAQAGATLSAGGASTGSTGVMVLSIGIIVIGVLNILFAFGILRGNRVARMVVTILQIIAIVSAVVGLFTPGSQVLQSISSVLFPLVIVSLLWTGAGTKDFFVRR